MAKKPTPAAKTADTSAPAAPASLNFAALATVVAATVAAINAGRSDGFAMAQKADADALAQAGYLVTDPTNAVDANGATACQATQAGIDFVNAQTPAAPSAAPAAPVFGQPPVTGTPAPASTPAAPAAPSTIKVFDVALPESMAVKTRAPKSSIYPFATMAVGQAFPVPKTADRPEPWKTMNSTVQLAQNTAKVATGQNVTVTRKGVSKTIPEMKLTKQFALRHIPDLGTLFGDDYKGVEGAAVFRIA